MRLRTLLFIGALLLASSQSSALSSFDLERAVLGWLTQSSAQAQATAIFTKVVLSATATSATTNALNYPLDAAERLFNVAGMNASVAR